MATQIEEVSYEAPPPWLRMLESLVITLAIPALGLIVHPSDPLFYHTGFSWLISAPLLVGLRYGFIHGFASAVGTVLIMFLVPRLGYGGQQLSVVYAMGVVLVGMLSGEFIDIWRRRLTQMQILNQYQTTRLDEFVRNYHLLRVSHDQLAERLAANPHNLRDAVLDLAERFSDVQPGQDVLRTRAAEIVSFMAEEGRLQQCGLYAVDEQHRVSRDALDTMGGMARDLDVTGHPMVRACLRQKCMISLKSEMAGELQDKTQTLLAVIPLIDVHDRIWALVAVQEMPFVVFERGNLHLLSVLGGNIGDIISEAYDRKPTDLALARHRFETQVRRWTQYARNYRLTSLMMAYEVPGQIRGVSNQALTDLIFEQLRALDFGWQTEARGDTWIIYVLMPLTPERGASAYRARMLRLLNERFGVDAIAGGLEFHQRVVDGSLSAEALLDEIQRAAEAHASA